MGSSTVPSFTPVPCEEGDLVLTVDGADSCNNQPHFSWNGGVAERYTLELARDSNFSDMIYIAEDIESTSLNNAVLPPGDIFWRLQATQDHCEGRSTSGSFQVLGSWIPIDGVLNYNVDNDAQKPVIKQDSIGNYYAAWSEKTGFVSRIVVSKWDGSDWTPLSAPFYSGTGSSASQVQLILVNDVPHVIFYESGTETGIFVMYFDGSNWVQLGSNMLDTLQADYPQIDVTQDGTLYAAWHEYNGGLDNKKIMVKSWNGTSWDPVGSMPLNLDPLVVSTNPSLETQENQVFVAWEEEIDGYTHIVVKTWNGTNWALLGSPIQLNATFHAGKPDLLRANNVLYVAWRETDNITSHIYTAYWNGSTWVVLGDSINLFPKRYIKNLELAASQYLYATYTEETTDGNKITLRIWDEANASWQQKGYYLNNDTQNIALNSDVIITALETPVTIWQEYTSGVSRIYVKEYQCP